LLDAGVRFYAALGNHDSRSQVSYEPFNMGGERYYTFTYGRVQFFALDTNRIDPVQVRWLEQQLNASTAEWKIAYFHHPLYSSGRYGSTQALRSVLEPLLATYGVNVVLAGHEHNYERIEPQRGVVYFTVGNAGSVRIGSIRPTPLTAAAFDADGSFMLVEVAGDELFFQVISRAGGTVDQGAFSRRGRRSEAL
jgi:3',5'-cyclic AMP phosphodiesterase CpdA